mgnify:CR=1 FL=1
MVKTFVEILYDQDYLKLKDKVNKIIMNEGPLYKIVVTPFSHIVSEGGVIHFVDIYYKAENPVVFTM